MSNSIRPIRRVTQQSNTSCGIACAAMLARIRYREALGAHKHCKAAGDKSATHYTDIDEIREIFAHLGWRLGRKVVTKDWSKVPPDCLVAVQMKKEKDKNDKWHWVVSVGQDETKGFFDPRKSVKTKRRKDFNRAPVAWYHHVSQTK